MKGFCLFCGGSDLSQRHLLLNAAARSVKPLQFQFQKEIAGKPTAQVMFFNGMSYSAKNGSISYLPNPYIENNLALTMQLKLASDSLVPGFARKVYLKSLIGIYHLLLYRMKIF